MQDMGQAVNSTVPFFRQSDPILCLLLHLGSMYRCEISNLAVSLLLPILYFFFTVFALTFFFLKRVRTTPSEINLRSF